MQKESRVQRWRANKREQGLKHVSVWLTPEEELRLKNLAVHWHCSPSEVMQQALAQVHRAPQADHSNPTDTLQIRTLILAELAALGLTLAGAADIVTGGEVVGPTETLPQSTAGEIPLIEQHEVEIGLRLGTESAPTAQNWPEAQSRAAADSCPPRRASRGAYGRADSCLYRG